MFKGQWAVAIAVLASLLFAIFPKVAPDDSILSSVDLLSASGLEISRLLERGTVSSRTLVLDYLRRIENDNHSGLHVNALICVTNKETLLALADERDAERKAGKLRGPLHGIPFVAKDTMVTPPEFGLPTTYGAAALKDSFCSENAEVVEKTIDAGGILLAPFPHRAQPDWTKLTFYEELGGFKEFDARGWSKVGGTTLNPYDGKDPCGSSSGSAVAVAAGFSPLALGTDTTGSITCPASFNALYGLRPTKGLLSCKGILPTTTTFDTPGILTKSSGNIGLWMNALTQSATGGDIDYVPKAHNSWKDWRIGVLDRAAYWNASLPLMATVAEEEEKIRACNSALDRMRGLGATIVDDATLPAASMPDEDYFNLMDRVTLFELKHGLDEFFSKLQHTPVRSVEDLVAWNNAHRDLAFSPEEGHTKQEWLEQALDCDMVPDERESALIQVREFGARIEHVLKRYDLDAVVFPAFSWMSVINAMAGTPFGSVPLDRYSNGRPFGLGFIMRRFDDKKLLQLMDTYEHTFPARLLPRAFRHQSLREKIWYYTIRLLRPVKAIF